MPDHSNGRAGSGLTRRSAVKLLSIATALGGFRPAGLFARQAGGGAPGADPERLRRRVADHPWRPRFHLAPPYGWMNDPHPFFFGGLYHLFYQFSSIMDRPYAGGHSWGHASSTNLVDWTHHPPALTPAQHGSDPDHHIWSGCLVDHDGVATAVYTIDNIDVWAAISADPVLARFEKSAGNPLIQGPPGPGWSEEMRDPWVWREAGQWCLIAGSALEGTGAVPLYVSGNFRDWEYLHPLFVGDPDLDGDFVECPSFHALGDRHLLAFANESRFHLGRYADRKFVAESTGRLDYGRVYAPQALRDDAGRVVMFGWIYETPPHGNGTIPVQKEWRGMFSLPGDQVESGFAGAHTLPRVLTLEGGGLRIDPAEEVDRLRQQHHRRRACSLRDGETAPLGAGGARFELGVRWHPFEAGAGGVLVACGDCEIRIGYDAEQRQAFVESAAGRLTAPLALAGPEGPDIRIYFDHSIVEAYFNRRVCITEHLYPRAPEAARASLFARGADLRVERAEGWTLRSSRQWLPA